ncbi:DUF2141 domain-containing protein [Tenacibaculum aestuariivivum]|uniref:DUF2141 domain-containing protein n=1 Tax=Tenacibaculum aestuariivivum TaxID=2006131 RepID=UPI003AB6B145
MKIIVLIGVFFLSAVLSSIAQEKYTITLHFEGMKSDKGSLYIAIYNKEDRFLKEPLEGRIVKIIDKKVNIVLNNVVKGEYAVSAFHDVNDNSKMDINFLGIPKEPIGISNNAKGFMGPPKYKNAKFEVTEDVKLTIKVN